jgi:integrase
MMGGAAPHAPRDLTQFSSRVDGFSFVTIRDCRTMEGLDRRIGQRRDATRAPTQARSGWRPSGRLLVSPLHHLRTAEILSKRWGPPQFPGQLPNQPLTRDAVANAIAQAAKRAGLTQPVSPHSLRHAYAVHLLETGTDVRRIQLLLGHRSLSTTARYLRLATTTVCATTSPLDLLPLLVTDQKS